MMRRRGEIATDFFAHRVGLFPSAREVLEELRQLNPPVRLGLATSSVSASARPFLDRHLLAPLFEVIITGDQVEHGKPHPEIYLRAAEELGLPCDACFVVEDSLSGVAAAKAAKMRVAAIPDTRFVDPREYARKADYLLESLVEIPRLIKNLRGP
jgi:HAD superfamily hydrolase (TIGR01509 family)